jgi:hypothetical protein
MLLFPFYFIYCTLKTQLLNRCELDPCVYDVFDSESALELNPEVVDSWDTLYSPQKC